MFNSPKEKNFTSKVSNENQEKRLHKISDGRMDVKCYILIQKFYYVLSFCRVTVVLNVLRVRAKTRYINPLFVNRLCI